MPYLYSLIFCHSLFLTNFITFALIENPFLILTLRISFFKKKVKAEKDFPTKGIFISKLYNIIIFTKAVPSFSSVMITT